MVSAGDDQLLQKLLEIAVDAKKGCDGERRGRGCRGEQERGSV